MTFGGRTVKAQSRSAARTSLEESIDEFVDHFTARCDWPVALPRNLESTLFENAYRGHVTLRHVNSAGHLPTAIDLSYYRTAGPRLAMASLRNDSS